MPDSADRKLPPGNNFSNILTNTPIIQNGIKEINLMSNYGNEHNLIRMNGQIANASAFILFDSGATHNFISKEFLKIIGLLPDVKYESCEIELGDGRVENSTGYINIGSKNWKLF